MTALPMEVILRNTDYALRLMVSLAEHWDQHVVSTRQLAEEQDVSYPLACKLMQKLSGARLVRSAMGGKGGYRLSRPADEMTLLEIVTAIQGPVHVNRCLLPGAGCSRRHACCLCHKLHEVQNLMHRYMAGVTLQALLGDPEVANRSC
jgi:Rrf2 family protein